MISLGVLGSDKSHVHILLKNFFTLIKTQFNCQTKIVRSDNGTEFFSKDLTPFLNSLGFINQTSCVKYSQQNGVVERNHKHMLDTARALRFNSHLPISFWGDCLLTATYLINRLPKHVLHGKSPYQMLFEKPPDYSDLKVFGCLCFATNLSPFDKFAPTSFKCVFLGCPYAQKGYRVMDLATRKFFVSRDVQFAEHMFPFKTISSIFLEPSLPMFPSVVPDIIVSDDRPSSLA